MHPAGTIGHQVPAAGGAGHHCGGCRPAICRRDASEHRRRAYDRRIDGDWQISGTYLESCNCDAICPCRRIDGQAGGRSTHGLCLGVLTWQIEQGAAGQTDLSGLAAVIVSRYHDDEAGSPWTFALFIDRRADERQSDALVRIFTGAGGGTALKQFPWAWKPSTFLGSRPAAIEIDHTPGHGRVRVEDVVELTIG
ncbi:MAG: DUF1326 domain-containing protein, partial [Gaiellales bacterium]